MAPRMLLADYAILLPQFLQNLASGGFEVPQDWQFKLVGTRLAPHLMQCFASARSIAPHLEQFFGLEDACTSGALGGARALGENTWDKMTTSPTVAMPSCRTSNSLGNSLFSSRFLNCSLSTDSTKDLISPVSLETALRTLPTIIPCESIT